MIIPFERVVFIVFVEISSVFSVLFHIRRLSVQHIIRRLLHPWLIFGYTNALVAHYFYFDYIIYIKIRIHLNLRVKYLVSKCHFEKVIRCDIIILCLKEDIA